MTDQPTSPDPSDEHTEVRRVASPGQTRVASYLANKDEVRKVLLLYSGGLDTSVMLKWIQDEYKAEVVALTVELGQPGEDYDEVTGKARLLGAVEAIVHDARQEFADEYLIPAIKANVNYGDGYPAFTSLGRPLIAKLAVEYARKHGCDTIAHGCTGKGNDQVRIEATVATLAPELKVIAPVRSWAMGRDEELAYAREHNIPVKNAPRAPRPRTRSTTTSGAAAPRVAGSRTSRTRRRTTSSSSSPGRRTRRTRPRSSPSASRAACRSRSTAPRCRSSS